MGSIADAEMVWPLIAALYLVARPGWDYITLWAARWAGRPGAWQAALRREPQAAWLRGAGQVVYSLGIPYAALLLGVADGRSLGVAGLPRWPYLPVGALLGLIGVLYLSWSWRRTAAAMFRRGSRHRLLYPEWQACRSPGGWVRLLLDVLCVQARWAFVRGAAVAALGVYQGVFLGLVLEGGAWLLRPGRPASLADPEARASALLTAGLALVTALVFLYAENLWLCALVHALGYLGAVLAAGGVYAHSEA